MADLRNELAKARDAWFESEDGQSSADTWTLSLHRRQELFLRNRLERAFVAGWEARERCHAGLSAYAVPSDYWRPIESAPVNDESVLLWWRTAKRARIGQYVDDERGSGWMCEGDQVIPKNQQDCLYWRPIPESPQPLNTEQQRAPSKSQAKRIAAQKGETP